ncbi:LPS assembly lipoprotein LptE [Desulfovibrio sp. Huiquan2017]|uniref:LPS assembly lipoprotein LptE n=1 Tax=Desulfovibrio sp. Huiquan2017 TaxID=2816861 RepID=UPI001A92093F|nr:LPS assembly lipoprotein LptE [Desulfovibrio sp. Huiquan2017]
MPLLRYTSILLLLALAGCGYSFGEGGNSVLKPQFRTLAVGEIENPTTLSWLEPRLRKLLRDELHNRGTITWVDDTAKADALITIIIDRYYRPTAVADKDDRTRLSTAIFRFDAVIRSTTDESELWRSGEIEESWPFDYGNGEKADMEVTRRGIQRLADRMTQDY